MFEQLGASASGIVSAASEAENVAVALKGAAVVLAIISESKRFFSLTVKAQSIFHEFASAAQQNRFEKMAEMIQEMASALKQEHYPAGYESERGT